MAAKLPRRATWLHSRTVTTPTALWSVSSMARRTAAAALTAPKFHPPLTVAAPGVRDNMVNGAPGRT